MTRDRLRLFAGLILGILLLAVCLYRDIVKVSVHHLVDLRNRVVGARLTADKRLPYFYRWKPGDPVRYYDPENADSSDRRLDTLSTITATPLFHHLFEPLAELPQSTLVFVWLGIEYLCWGAILTLFLFLAETPRQKFAVAAAGFAFLFSMTWKVQVAEGQIYFIIPLLAALVYTLVLRKPSAWTGMAVGLGLVLLVGIRPNTILIFLPFLLAARRFPLSFRLAAAATVVVVVSFMAASPFERSLWQQFHNAVSLHIRSHLALQPFINTSPERKLPVWEGIDQFALSPKDAPTSNEKGNFFIYYDRYLHRTISLEGLTLLTCAVLGGLCIFFLGKNYRRRDLPLAQLVLFGYCLYMVTDLFSPVTRWLYYSVQWLFPILLVLSRCPVGKKAFYALFFAGLALTIINIRFIPYEHTAGDCILLGAILLFSFGFGDKDASNPLPARV